MTRLRFMLREIWRNLYRYPGTAIGSLLSLTLIFFLFDIFWVAAGTSNRVYSDLLSQLQVEAFIADNVPDSAMSPLVADVSDLPGVQSVRFVSRDEARQELTRLVGTDLLMEYDTLNPLPRSLFIDTDPSLKNPASMSQLETSLRLISGISDVSYSRDWLAKAEETRSLVNRIGFALGVIILLTAVITSGNSIRLMTRVRGGGFGQMQLLGAGRLFVALPLMLEGFLICAAAAGIGWGVILYGRRRIVFSQFAIVLPPINDILLFCGATALLGFLSGFAGVRRFVK